MFSIKIKSNAESAVETNGFVNIAYSVVGVIGPVDFATFGHYKKALVVVVKQFHSLRKELRKHNLVVL